MSNLHVIPFPVERHHKTNADLAPSLIANGYEPIPLYPMEKKPIGAGWQKRPVSLEWISEAQRDHGAINIGCRTGKLVGVDLDVFTNHPKFDELKDAIEAALGNTPLVRWGRKGCVLLFRTDKPLKKIRLDLQVPRMKDGPAIEVLGDGQQVVFFGTHPATQRDYLWGGLWALTEGTGPDPLSVPLVDLPRVTPETINIALAAAAHVMGVPEHDDWVEATQVPSAAKGDPLQIKHVGDLLDYIDPDCSRDVWIKVIAGMRACNCPEDADGNLRLDIVDTWSARGEKYLDRADVSEVWNTMPPKVDGVGYGTLYHLAREGGYCGAPAAHAQLGAAVFAKFADERPPLAARSDAPIFDHYIGKGDTRKPDPKRVENTAKLVEWMGFSLRRNIFTGLTEIGGGVGGFTECTDDKIENIWAAGNSTGLRPSYQDLVRNINVIANQFEHHPVRDYLAGLVWDGKPRVATWLSVFAGAANTRLNEEFGRVTLLGAVHRVLYPGCKFDYMLVLEGPQGAKKSSLFERLAGGSPWFTDSIKLGSDPKVTIEQTRGVWIAECAELKGMRANEIEAVKAQITTQVDRARLAYAHHPVTVPRQFVMVGTTNDSQYLRDPTGNRRFLPVAVGAIDLEAMVRDRDQLWAEAYRRVIHGEMAILAPDVLKEASDAQAARALPDAIRERLSDLLDGFQGWVAKEDLWTALGRPDAAARKQTEQNALADAMRELGWVPSRQRRGGKPLYCFTKGTANEWLNLMGGRNPHFAYDEI